MIIKKIEEGRIVRIADSSLIHIKYFGNTYVKHVTREHDIVKELYDSNGNLKGVDVIIETPDEIEVIYNLETRKTIVIIKDSKGRKFKGMAICRKEDEYDSTRGYTIAHSRAVIKQELDRIERLSQKGVLRNELRYVYRK